MGVTDLLVLGDTVDLSSASSFTESLLNALLARGWCLFLGEANHFPMFTSGSLRRHQGSVLSIPSSKASDHFHPAGILVAKLLFSLG